MKHIARIVLALLVLLGIGWAFNAGFTATLMAALSAGSLVVFGTVLDERLEFADATSVAAAASTALIGDVINLGSIGRNLDKLLYLVISVDTEIITGGSAGTIEFILASDAQAAIATDGSATHHFVSAPFVTDDAAVNDAILSAGRTIVCIPLPGEGPTYEQYLGILVRIGTTTVTAGKVNAYLTHDPKQWKALDNGIAGV